MWISFYRLNLRGVREGLDAIVGEQLVTGQCDPCPNFHGPAKDTESWHKVPVEDVLTLSDVRLDSPHIIIHISSFVTMVKHHSCEDLLLDFTGTEINILIGFKKKKKQIYKSQVRAVNVRGGTITYSSLERGTCNVSWRASRDASKVICTTATRVYLVDQ